MLVVPLVFCSIVMGVISVSNSHKLVSICGSTIGLYIFTYAIALFISASLSILIGPGNGVNISDIAQTSNEHLNQTVTQLILNIIPENPFYTLSDDNNMLGIIIIALFVGIILIKLEDKIQILNTIFEELNKVMIEMTRIILKFAPVGVFCMMASTFGSLEFGSLIPLTNFIICILIALAVQFFVVYPILLFVFTGLNPVKFIRKFKSVIVFAFATLSSNATIPMNMNKLSTMGVSKEISSFTIPLGATINKDGTTIIQCIAVFFIAQIYGIDLGTSTLLTMSFIIILSASNSLSVPFSGSIALTWVFSTIGLPVETIGILLCADNLLDTFKTSVNVTGDAICTTIVAFRQKAFDMDVFDGKKEHEK